MSGQNNELQKLINSILYMNTFEFTLLAIVLAYLISDKLTINQQASVGNFFELLGQVLLSINAQNVTLNQHSYANKEDLNEAVRILSKKINNLDKIIEDFKNYKL